jgi:hypothetical protein
MAAVLAHATLEWQQLQLNPPWPAAHRLMLRLASADEKRHCPLTLAASLSRQPRQSGRYSPPTTMAQELSPQGSPQHDFLSATAPTAGQQSEWSPHATEAFAAGSPPTSPPIAAMSLLKRPVGLRQFALSVDLHNLTRLTSHPQTLRVGWLF